MALLFLGLVILGTQPAMARPFCGRQPKAGLRLSLQHHEPASDQSLLLTHRQDEYGIISLGLDIYPKLAQNFEDCQ